MASEHQVGGFSKEEAKLIRVTTGPAVREPSESERLAHSRAREWVVDLIEIWGQVGHFLAYVCQRGHVLHDPQIRETYLKTHDELTHAAARFHHGEGPDEGGTGVG